MTGTTLLRKLRPILLLAAGVLLGSMGTSVLALEWQPKMMNALNYLAKAKEELEGAARDKGGHRVNAIRLINAAMEEVRRGIRYDNRYITPQDR